MKIIVICRLLSRNRQTRSSLSMIVLVDILFYVYEMKDPVIGHDDRTDKVTVSEIF